MDSIHFAVLLSLVVCIANLIVRHYRNKLAEKEIEEQEATRVYFNEDGKMTRLTGLTNKEFSELLISINNRKVKQYGK